MRHLFRNALLSTAVILPIAGAQTAGTLMPEAVFAAKTVAIVDDTHTPGVTKGATDALQSWGQFKVIDDPQLADLTLRFEKNRNREGRNTEAHDPNGKDSSYGYSMSFSSSIRMTASLRNDEKPFYITKTDDSRNKAGISCINSFHTAYRDAHQQPKP